MYSIGDKIVYPTHGAGVIVSIQEKEVLGQKQNYYILKMPLGAMDASIPTQNADVIGIRNVIEADKVDSVLDVLRDQSVNVNTNWNKRYRENMIKIKSGNIYEVADVVRTLMQREKSKGLSTGERKMLNNAKQILISEIVLSKGIDQAEIEEIINGCIEITE